MRGTNKLSNNYVTIKYGFTAPEKKPGEPYKKVSYRTDNVSFAMRRFFSEIGHSDEVIGKVPCPVAITEGKYSVRRRS